MAERVGGGRRWVVVAALLAAGALAIGAWEEATSWAPSPTRYPLQGLDLELDPPAVEWPTARAAGADFAYLVATDGADRREPSFEANWAALAEAGLRRGAVHLYTMCAPAARQADAFNLVVPRDPGALPAAVDVSFRGDCPLRPDAAALTADLRLFLARVEAHTGKPVLLRVSRAVEQRYRLTRAIDRGAWAMADLFPPSYTAHPWRLWRASRIHHIAGAASEVNWDVVAP